MHKMECENMDFEKHFLRRSYNQPAVLGISSLYVHALLLFHLNLSYRKSAIVIVIATEYLDH